MTVKPISALFIAGIATCVVMCGQLRAAAPSAQVAQPVAKLAPEPAQAIAPTVSASADGLQFFEKKIRPLLVEQCYKCHSTQASKLKGELFLDSQHGMLKGGTTAAVVVPGHADQSLLIDAVSYKDDDLKMPPKTRLPEAAVADLTKWVQMGAPMPADPGGAEKLAAPSGPARATTADYERLRKEHWAWQPLHVTPAPTTRNQSWPRTDADRFILSALEAKSLAPVSDADRATLIRRVTFDLIGLPPTPDETSSFMIDKSPDSYEHLVDRLLASPAFGERWGRHWLDVVRYAESTGSSRNYPYAYAWKYRDWVIKSFNDDKPYNHFVTEQIAGDLMPFTSPQQHDEQRVATGFLAMGIKDVNEKDRLKYMMDNIDEQIDVTSRSIMGLTVSCARCHDHKFDPIPQADYYAIAGIFRSTEILSGVHNRVKGGGLAGYNEPTLLVHLDLTAAGGPPQLQNADVRKAQAAAALHVADLEAKVLKDTQEIAAARRQAEGKPGNGKEYLEAVKTLRKDKQELDEAQIGAGTAPDPSVAAMGVREAQRVSDTAICLHGDADNTGATVTRGFLSLFTEQSMPQVNRATSGRLQLADWLTRNDNPLTARVMANRVWEHLFGDGLVRTVDNFGTTGEAPSNPLLLDALADQFMKNGWSVKKLVRSLVLSHIYQLASTRNPANFLVDPSDRLQWRMEPRRLDAEEIHDAMLAASGALDRSQPGGSELPVGPNGEMRIVKSNPGPSSDIHRALYLPIVRDMVPPMLELFDFAEPTLVTGQRDVTTVATQALFMMNDPFVIQQSHRLATRLISSARDDSAKVDLAYERCVGRTASESERGRALRYISQYANGTDRTHSREDGWASFCQALMAGGEFRYLN